MPNRPSEQKTAPMVDTIRRFDRPRKGLAPKEVANLGHEIRPALSDEQARNLLQI